MTAFTPVRDFPQNEGLGHPKAAHSPFEALGEVGQPANPVSLSDACGLEGLFDLKPAPQGLALHHVHFSEAVSWEFAPFETLYVLQLTLCGAMRTTCGGLTVEANAGDFTVINSRSSGRHDWEQGSEHLFLLIGSCDLERAVGVEIGDRSRRKISFSNQPTAADKTPTLFDYVRLLRQDLGSSRTFVNPTAAKLSVEMLACLMLRLLPNDKQRQMQTAKSPAAPYYVLRAIDFADERFGESISLRDMALASGVCSRTLDKGFRRFCDKSPMEHLRSVRLENARTQLMRAQDELTTVSSTARLCGFRHLGRFAEYYARQFGELPSQTRLRQQA